MRRTSAILGSAIFLVVAPVTVAGVAPWLISHWGGEPSATGFLPLRAAGVLLVAAGALILLDSFARFALQGLGTPAPAFPTRHLIITGCYRYVRNPMYVAVVAIIAGQWLVFADVRVLGYGVLVWLGFHCFVVTYEEPTLRTAYGPEYELYSAGVRRWIPRLSPWQAPR
ncbi:MAG: isoprenylcysteine carboxylmethyltransferase family protein [Acidobacteria bacterium]|nr:isoprenylcysteine carboxylmethyltransferase family protein [Acidobacteriota bacterium]